MRFRRDIRPGLLLRLVLGKQGGMLCLERVGNIFKENETEHDMLVVRGLKIAPELVSRKE
jgi:hypothetical protein